jgi:uncharacterized protein
MKKVFIIFGIILLIFAGVVFYQFRQNATTKTGGANRSSDTATIKINDKTFNVEVADSPEKWQKGLSGRDSLPKDQGMLFLFKTSEYHNFWMKDMKFPIDIIFINNDTVVSIVKDAKPPASNEANLPLYKPEAPIDTVLEINAKLSDEYEIKKGDKVEIKL